MYAAHVLVAALALAAGASARERRIVDGKISAIEDAPWKIQIEYLKKNSATTYVNDYSMTCTAILVSKRQALTAAHCLGVSMEDLEKNAKNISNFARLRLGSTDKFGRGGVSVPIKSAVVNPRYLKYEASYDIAVLNLFNDVPLSEQVQPIKISNRTPQEKEVLHIGGWGRIDLAKRMFHKRLKTAEVTVLGDSVCQPVRADRYDDASAPLICVEAKTGITAGGDSGCSMWDSRKELVGVLRGGFKLDLPNFKEQISIFVDVTAPAVRCFLGEHLERGLVAVPDSC